MRARPGGAGIVVLIVLGLVAGLFFALRLRTPPPPAPTLPSAPAGIPAAKPEAPSVEAGTLVLKGRVVYKGEIPERKKLPVTKDEAVCGCGTGFKLDESLVVDPGTRGVANAVVWVRNAGPGPALPPATVDQKGCVFAPHVALVPTGSKVTVLNPEPVAHNYHWQSDLNNPGNLTIMKSRRASEAGPFEKPEFVPVVCDIHPWMRGWLAVMGTGCAAVTDEKGTFTIQGLPPGRWEVAVWHETLATAPKDVRVENADTVEIALP